MEFDSETTNAEKGNQELEKSDFLDKEPVNDPPKTSKSKSKFIEKFKIFWSKPKNRIITESVLGLLVIIIVGAVLFKWFNEKNTSTEAESVKNNEVAKTEEVKKLPSILDGTMVPEAFANRHPLGVIIENHVDARPQSGLPQAGIVYEAIAEGGITRYLALFSGYDAPKVGPIRSARTYFVDIARGYNAYLSHVGGNYDALEKIKAEGILDLDQFQNSVAYARENLKGVSSEHTMYSSTAKLYELAEKKSYTKANTFSPLKFKSETAETSRPASQVINIEYGSAQYKVIFTYDPKNNNYKRTIGKLPDQDRQTSQTIAPKNIIIQEVTRTSTVTKINENGYSFQLTGSGKAQIFQDGKQVVGTWKKSSSTDRTIFLDAQNQEIQLNPGQTWICITHPELKVTVE